MTHIYIKCPHCKHVKHIAGKTYDYTIGSPLSICDMCGKPVLDNRKREWIMFSPVQKIWHFVTARSILPASLIGLFLGSKINNFLDDNGKFGLFVFLVITLISMFIWGYLRYHNETVQQEIRASIQRTENLQYRTFLEQYYTLYDTHIPFQR